jgi:protein-S-isoprenylcysteine O-methyltransferase Ste14
VNNLASKSVRGFTQLITALGILLLAPAWTLDYWQAWVYLFVFAASSALIAAYLWKKDQRLLERRINAGPGAENEKSQKLIQLLASFVFIGAMILPSLDHRFSWSAVPLSIVVTGDVLVALGFLIVFLVFKENTFTAATIAVTPGQKVVSTGPYAVVRHPMYAGAARHALWYAACARIVVGARDVHSDDLHHRMASSRRGAVSSKKSSRLPAVLPDGSISSGAVCLVEGRLLAPSLSVQR